MTIRPSKPCIYCEEPTRATDQVCGDCYHDDFEEEDTELTAADEAAYERYKERADFDYWHRFD
jgi:hypothetical protein